MSDAAIATIVTGVCSIVTTLVGFLIVWIKLKYGVEKKADEAAKKAGVVEQKLDDNTRITVAGAESATTNAKVAAQAATSAKASTEAISKKLNGGIDAAIKEGVQPVLDTLHAHADTLQTHIEDDKKVAEEIRGKFDELTEYVHNRNHDMLDALQTHANKLELISRKIDQVK